MEARSRLSWGVSHHQATDLRGVAVREIPVHNEARLDPARIATIYAAVQALPTLGDVLTWSRAGTRSRQPIDIVTQDEYTHDVMFDLDGRVYLAFDTT